MIQAWPVGEEIQTGRLGIRVRPGTAAAAKVTALEAHGGAELLRQVLQEQKQTDGTGSAPRLMSPSTANARTTCLTPGFSHVRQARIAEPGKVPRRLRPTLVEGDDLEPFNLVAGTVNRLTIDSRLRFKVFDWLILDEANKVSANEALALMPLAKRWVMIGDLNQLTPVIEEAASTFKIVQPLDEVVHDDSFYEWIWEPPSRARSLLCAPHVRLCSPARFTRPAGR